MSIHIRLSLIVIAISVTIVIIQKIDCDADDILVETPLGIVKGTLMKTVRGNDFYAFRGIYYTEPPIGKLRFKDPVPIQPWDGVFDATDDGPACIQYVDANNSENCLTLNIYTKQIRNINSEIATKVPVIVFIHPGAYMIGSSQSFVYGPSYLLDQDVVLVTINHRLSTLGFINTGDEYSSGNYGFKDQVVALEFVRDNIAAFGGDPNSVTLAGHSSGARSIILHIVSPMFQGLFHKAIAMSGTSIIPIPPQKQQIDLAVKQARLLNCTTETREEMFRCLREKPAKDFGETVKSFKLWHKDPVLVWYPSMEPDIPGSFLTDNPEKLIKKGKIHPVPLIISYTKDEFAFRALIGIEKSLKGDNTYFEDLDKRWLELAPICFGYERDTERSKVISQQIRQYYFGNDSITVNNSDILKKLYSHALSHYPIYRTAVLLTNFSSSPVHFYEFSYQSPDSGSSLSGTTDPAAGVAHGDDLPYLFDSDYEDAPYPTFTEEHPEYFMVDRLTSIWAHFAKTSEPLPKDRKGFEKVTWPSFNFENEYYLKIGKEMTVEKDLLPETKQFWDRLFTEYFET